MLDSQMSTVTPTTKLPVENPLAPLMLALDSGPIPGRVLAASQFLRAALTISYSLGSPPPRPRSCGSGTLSPTDPSGGGVVDIFGRGEDIITPHVDTVHKAMRQGSY